MATTCQPFREGKQQQRQELVYLHHGGRTLPSSSRRSQTEAQALKIHSEAERRRRERINAHLATLRRMIPDGNQMDKATLLAQVVSQLKELKKNAAETTQPPPGICIPAEANGVAVACYTGAAVTGHGRAPAPATYIRASVSCDDRPGLHADLTGALRAMMLRPLRAGVASLGGRARCDFLLCREEAGDVVSAAAGGRVLKALEQRVRQALAAAAFPETPPYGCNARGLSRRRRLVGSRWVLGHGMDDGEHGW